ncbi:Papain-like cysteine peptidase superfamily [Sesbania bispinosa]|nr:Papain-like cysteine peptidase superfamily [Sesbania bispinosa]
MKIKVEFFKVMKNEQCSEVEWVTVELREQLLQGKGVGRARYVHCLCISKGNTKVYGFIDPAYTHNASNKLDEIQNYIQERICTGKKECYLAPCLHANHWKLVIICPQQKSDILLCSLWNKSKKELRSLVDFYCCMSYAGRYPLSKYKEAYMDFSSLSKTN